MRQFSPSLRDAARSNRPYLAAILTIAIVGLWLAVPAAFADLITLDTGTAPYDASWTVTRTLIGGESVPNADSGDSAGDSYTYLAVDVADPYSSWLQASSLGDGLAEWVSWDPSTGQGYEGDAEVGSITNDGTSYVYTDTFTLNGAPNAVFEVNGALLAGDNVITGISLEDETAAVSVPLTISYNPLSPTQFYYQASSFSAFASGLFPPTQTFTLTVDVVNWDGSRFNDPEGTGFILDGSAITVVPEPSSMLLCVGAVIGTLLRRRR